MDRHSKLRLSNHVEQAYRSAINGLCNAHTHVSMRR